MAKHRPRSLSVVHEVNRSCVQKPAVRRIRVVDQPVVKQLFRYQRLSLCFCHHSPPASVHLAEAVFALYNTWTCEVFPDEEKSAVMCRGSLQDSFFGGILRCAVCIPW